MTRKLCPDRKKCDEYDGESCFADTYCGFKRKYNHKYKPRRKHTTKKKYKVLKWSPYN